jgi:hypothetical protein
MARNRYCSGVGLVDHHHRLLLFMDYCLDFKSS